MVQVAILLWRAISILYSAPVSGILEPAPCFNVNRSAVAFLTIAWQSETLYNLDLTDLPETGNCPSSSMNSSHGSAFVASNSSSKVVTFRSEERRVGKKCKFLL